MKTSEWLKRYGIVLKKRLGQHFLSDEAVAVKIAEDALIQPDEHVIEIGPGAGTLTRALLEKASRLTAVEIDSRLHILLKERFAGYPTFRLIIQDFLLLGRKDIILENPFLIVSNLPYNVGVAILQRIWKEYLDMDRGIFMLQKEVVDRLCASPSTKAYGSLSIFSQSLVDIRVLCSVGPSHFLPNPQVESVVIEMKPKKAPLLNPEEYAAFSRLIRSAFSQRRKMIRTTLASVPNGLKALEVCEINVERRPETLSVQEYHQLYDALKGMIV